MTRRRSKQPPEEVQLPVKLPHPLNSDIAATVVRELVKFTLHFQNQIPGTYDQISQAVQEALEEESEDAADDEPPNLPSWARRSEDVEPARKKPRKKKRWNVADRRLMKFMSAADSLLRLVTGDLLVEGQATEALVILGASPARPKLVYHLPLCECGNSGDSLARAAEGGLPPRAGGAASTGGSAAGGSGAGARGPPAAQHKQTMDCCRCVLRALVQAAADTPASEAPAKLFLLLRAPAEIGVHALPHFLPKRGFAAVWRKVAPISIVMNAPRPSPRTGPAQPAMLVLPPEAQEMEEGPVSPYRVAPSEGPMARPLEASSSDSDDDDDSVADGDPIWYQCSIVLKGLHCNIGSMTSLF